MSAAATLADRAPFAPTRSRSESALKASALAWFLATAAGQLVFAFTVAVFYSSAVARGYFLAFNRFMTHGYVPGDKVGNAAVGVHLVAAVLITLSGLIQLVPQVRQWAPAFHRWNGRVYILTAFSTSLAGLYMLWVRGTGGDLSQHLGSTLDAVLVLLCAAMALRTALARDFKSHRPWALRLFLVVSAGWFSRLGMSLSLLVFRGPFGFDPATSTGPFLTFLSFGQTLVPLALLELYLRAKEGSSVSGRVAMAASLLVLTLATGAGTLGATMIFWRPALQAAFDGKRSVAEPLFATIRARGVDAAVVQYRQLKSAAPDVYNFAERELNTLGYALLRTQRVQDAIRILQLNAEAFPSSPNVYDSLGEAYVVAGDKLLAVANYRRSLELGNRGAAAILQRLTAP